MSASASCSTEGAQQIKTPVSTGVFLLPDHFAKESQAPSENAFPTAIPGTMSNQLQ